MRKSLKVETNPDESKKKYQEIIENISEIISRLTDFLSNHIKLVTIIGNSLHLI